MDGVAAIRYLLANNAPMVALVPAARISAGDLPQGVTLPAISVDFISGIDRNIVEPGMTRHVTERVQVTCFASTYVSLKALQRAVKTACADTFPTISGISNVVVHTDGQGPDFRDEANSIRMGTQDFRVSYTQTV